MLVCGFGLQTDSWRSSLLPTFQKNKLSFTPLFYRHYYGPYHQVISLDKTPVAFIVRARWTDFFPLCRIQEHRQIGSISLLKSGKMSSNSLSDNQQQQELTSSPLEIWAPADSAGHSTPSLPLFESLDECHGSGASTPSHQKHSHQNQAVSANSASVDARDLVDALNKQLCLNPTSNEENKRRMTLTLTN